MIDYYSLIDADIKSRLSQKRYEHSVCVAQSCVELARRYGANVWMASIAGIGHDVLKELTRDEFLGFFSSEKIELTSLEMSAPKLWHAVAGAVYLKNTYGLDDEIISAVRYHTTGKLNMTLLEKVLYVADFISDDRDYPGVDEMRKRAKISLESAMLEGLRFTVNELSEKCVPIHPDTFEAYNEISLRSLNK